MDTFPIGEFLLLSGIVAAVFAAAAFIAEWIDKQHDLQRRDAARARLREQAWQAIQDLENERRFR